MTEAEVQKIIKDIPDGSKLQLLKKNGDIIEVMLANHDISATEEKDYGDIKVPALPAALTVRGGSRFGNFRIDLDDISNIAWIE